MKLKLILSIFLTSNLIPFNSYTQSSELNSMNIPVYKSTLFERQLIQYANQEIPNSRTGVYSGVVSNYNIDNSVGFADFRFNSYSAPKSVIYAYIISQTNQFIDNPIFPKDFRNKIINKWIEFSDTYSKDKNQNISIKSKTDYLKLKDSLDKMIEPFYLVVNNMGAKILDSIQSIYSKVLISKSQIVRNSKVDKLTANKYWETNYTLFDAYTDKPISLEIGNPPSYDLFIYNEKDNLDSLINLRISDIQNNYNNKTYRNSLYSPNLLSTINGIKFQNIDNFYNWVKMKYPEKFVRTELSNSSKIQNSKSSDISNKEISENKNLESFLKLLASSNNNSSRTQTISSNQSGKCNDCNGTGKCRGCNRVFQKPYFTNGYYNKRSEIKLGYTLCQSCMGKGFKDRSIGSGYQIIGDCPSSKCQDGWEGCYLCNLGGQRRDIGKCVKCRGTGRK